MDIPVHNKLMWYACVKASRRLANKNGSLDPRAYFPFLVRGSWANDINQASAFTDQMVSMEAGEPVKKLFCEVWKYEKNNLLLDMKNGPVEAREVYDKAAAQAQTETTVLNDFGRYKTMDHFDVLNNDPAVEYEHAENNGKSAKTVHATKNLHLASHVRNFTFDDDSTRFNFHEVTLLGRLLHTLQDFFAHTNYIELLLWQLAWKGDLASHVTESFNEPAQFLENAKYARLFCPLPRNPGEIQNLTRKNTIMWYGPSPEKTPIVSTLFDRNDTIYTLIKMLGNHLEHVDDGSQAHNLTSDDVFNMVLVVFGFPQQDALRYVYKIYREFSSIFKGIADHVKDFAYDQLIKIAEHHTKDAKLIVAYANIMKKYDRAEASDWEKAGKYRYIQYFIKKELAEELTNQTIEKPKIPHHSLLNKDHVFENAEDTLRFHLAGIMAVNVSADILCEYFSKEPSVEKLDAIIDRYISHPSLQCEQNKLNLPAVHNFISQSFGARWNRLLEHDLVKN